MSLAPSQRVQLIREIVRRLSPEEWPLIDVTLRQFGLPTSDDWRGTKDSYLVDMIENGADDVLASLAGHLGFVLEQQPDRIEPSFWRKGYLRLFVSHLAEFREDAAALQDQLSSYGVTAFVAHNDIAPSTEWQHEIEAALATADCLVALLQPGFHASNWTDQEVGYAMGRSLPVFSVRLGEDPCGFIGRFQAFQGSGKGAAALASELFDVLVKHKQTRRRSAEALLLRVEESDSFAQAKANVGHLERATYWHPSFNERLETAAKTNGQIQGSWGGRRKSINSLRTVREAASNLMGRAAPLPPPGFDDMSVEDKIDYVQALWDRIAANEAQVPVPDWHREVLEERLTDHEANPNDGRSWEEVEADLIKRRQ